MSEAEFSAVEVLLRIARPFSQEKIECARLVLVEGKSMSDVAAIYGSTKQNFQALVTKIDKCLLIYKEAKAIEASLKKPKKIKTKE